MRKPNYPIMVAVPAFMLVASPLCAVAQRGPGLQGSQLVPERAIPRARPQQSARLPHSPLRTQNFGVNVYLVDWLGGRVAGITQPATVATAGGGMWAVSGISTPRRRKVNPTTCPTLRLRTIQPPRRRPRHPQNPTLFLLSPRRFIRHPLSDIRGMF